MTVTDVFGSCRFLFGLDHATAAANATMRADADYVTAWAGSSETFNLKSLFTDALAWGKVPVMYGYIIAFTSRRDACLQDCNVSNGTCADGSPAGTANLCNSGATYMRAHLVDRIIPQYQKYAQGAAQAYGTTKPVVWLMEPDYYQYSTGGDPNSLTAAEAGSMMHQIVTAIRTALPNSVFSMDISPWISNPATWYGSFTMSDFTFMNTSGGSTSATTTRIRPSNTMTWNQIVQLTGKPVLADDNYGQGISDWFTPTNLNARIADGVLAIGEVKPPADWSNLSTIRTQLNAPPKCP